MRTGEAWFLYCAWRYGGEDPFRLYNIGKEATSSPHPFRLKCFMYAMADYAQDEELKIHGVHPSQHGRGEQGGTEMRMPGGAVGTKPRVK